MANLSPNIKRYFLAIIGLSITIGLGVWVLEKTNLSETWQVIKGVPVLYWTLLVSIYLFSFVVRASRWTVLVNSRGHNSSFLNNLKSILIGYAANNIIPARGGELVRMEYYTRNTQVDRVTSFSLIALERVFDALALALILFITYWSLKISVDWVDRLLVYLTLAGFCCLGVGFLMFVLGKRGFLVVLKNERIRNIINKVAASIGYLSNKWLALKFVALSVFVWVIEGLMFGLVLQAYSDLGSPFVTGYFLLSIVNFAVLIPSSPGYIGVFQSAVMLALSLFDIGFQKALDMSIVVHASQYFPITLLGLGIFANSWIKNIRDSA